MNVSQAEQRKGRTGRTCDGVVYRLVTGSFYGQLDDYEAPAILNLSLRQHVLLICCAESKIINEPKGGLLFSPSTLNSLSLRMMGSEIDLLLDLCLVLSDS